MGHTNFRLSLEKRYAGFAGELRETHENIERIKREILKLPELEADIARLEGLIESAVHLLQDGDPNWQRDQVQAVKPFTHKIPVPFGSCGRRGMNILRDAHKPMTAREIAIEVLRQQGVEDADRDTVHRTRNAVEATLRKNVGRGVETSGKYPMQWRSVINPTINFDE